MVVNVGEPSRTFTPHSNLKETVMQWSKPEFIDFRFGFEITLYVFNR